MLQRVFNHTSMFKRFSSQTLTLRSFQTLISPIAPQPQSVHVPRLHSFLTATAARELHAPRLNSLQAKCFSTSSVVDTVEWKEMDVVAKVTEVIDFSYFAKTFMSVRAFFLGKSVDVVSLRKKYRRNCVSLRYISGMPRDHVVLRFGNTNPKTIALDAIIGSDIRYMVVNDYGSVILLNFRDSEINEHLEMVKVHASDGKVSSVYNYLLPENAPLKLNVCGGNTAPYRWSICLGSKYGGEMHLYMFKM